MKVNIKFLTAKLKQDFEFTIKNTRIFNIGYSLEYYNNK